MSSEKIPTQMRIGIGYSKEEPQRIICCCHQESSTTSKTT